MIIYINYNRFLTRNLYKFIKFYQFKFLISTSKGTRFERFIRLMGSSTFIVAILFSSTLILIGKKFLLIVFTIILSFFELSTFYNDRTINSRNWKIFN